MEAKLTDNKVKLSEKFKEVITTINKFHGFLPPTKTDLKNALDPKLKMLLEYFGEISLWLDRDVYAIARDQLQYCHRLIANLDELKLQFPNERALIGNIKVTINKQLEPLIKDIDAYITYTAQELYDFDTKTIALKEEQRAIVESTEIEQSLIEVLSNVAKLVDIKLRSPRIFFSYAWPTRENKESEAWVQPFLKNLYNHLRSAGLRPIMDLMDIEVGGNINLFMKQAHTSEFVILFCTPSLLCKHSDPAWFALKTELSHIDFKHNLDLHTEQARIMPIQLSGTYINSFPEKYKLNSNVQDWRDKGYAKSLESTIGQIFFGAEAIIPAEYKACWQPFYDLVEEKKQQSTAVVVL